MSSRRDTRLRRSKIPLLGAVVSRMRLSLRGRLREHRPMKSLIVLVALMTSSLEASPAKRVVVVSSRRADVQSSVTTALEQNNFKVLDGNIILSTLRTTDVSDPIPDTLPSGARSTWSKVAKKCRARCVGATECEPARACFHDASPTLEEAWLKALGAHTSLFAAVEATQAPVSVHVWGQKVCELASIDFESGTNAPSPGSLRDALALAGSLALRIANGEGRSGPRAASLLVVLPTEPAELKRVLGCP